jgi:hypothetical protein
MANDEEAGDDLPSDTAPRMTELTGEAPISRLDYGDADQRVEMDGVDDDPYDEPVALVDAPLQIRQPFTRTEKRRNQRPLPT